MSMNERLKAARKMAGYASATEAAQAMGIAVGTYAGHENGNRTFDVETAKRYAKFYKVALTWLLTGEGPTKSVMRDEESRLMNQSGDARRSLVDNYDPEAPDEQEETDNVYSLAAPYKPRLPGARPEIDVRLGAGQGTIGDGATMLVNGVAVSGHRVVGEWVFPEHFFRHELRAATNSTIIQEVIGDSMAGTLNSGDRAIIDTSQNRYTQDGIYSFDDGDGEPRVKRLQKVLFSQPELVHIISDNPTHPPQTVELSRVRIIGRIVGKVSRL